MKGQLQLVESTLVIFVFSILLVTGMGMYHKVQKDRFSQLEDVYAEQEAMSTAQRVLTIPEIACTQGGIKSFDCIDVQKLAGFQARVQERSRYYQEVYGNTLISTTWVYAPSFQGLFTAPTFFATTPGDFSVDPETTRILFNFSAGKEDRTVFHYPITLADTRFVPQRKYYGFLTVEVYS